ncbi:MAG: hypothetical protein LBK61_11400 [Spirochaetaceae bacterium]|jgi:DNA-directed RNA polymerase subunit RPC12/RpoP|nr:hypothetical protein [Spirochaetaceae bacterium]
MKKVCVILLLALLCAALSFAADGLTCKWCGSSSFTSVQHLVTGNCAKSPTRKHALYPGAPRRAYVCKYCAAQATSLQGLVSGAGTCSRSPRRFHEAYEGPETYSYSCKNCGATRTSLNQLITSPCPKTAWGYHDPL